MEALARVCVCVRACVRACKYTQNGQVCLKAFINPYPANVENRVSS